MAAAAVWCGRATVDDAPHLPSLSSSSASSSSMLSPSLPLLLSRQRKCLLIIISVCVSSSLLYNAGGVSGRGTLCVCCHGSRGICVVLCSLQQPLSTLSALSHRFYFATVDIDSVCSM